ncbi:ImmA/IrrE family metallo-endopeptidase [Mesorhizobium sp. B2-4-2]|uniref:ImmA/IrrE family metallo-endopeptidase n=1 Tax=Mesorhizobium sp. B2-4-2 TaxID=2589947 RepID=UPI001128B2F1|nr:XRE family transcriptional regulator [Mesorhizobium sp. B2-4-2]TPL55513.1 ImmA/IrrE family metallo-endopeptidase [Mesorhizobium sp. B2-4-2]
MTKSTLAYINPAILRWARDQARLSPEAAAEGIGISADKLQACEAGDKQLTFPQFLAAANFYKRAPAIFYLNEPPAGFQPIQDFRRLRETPEDAFKSGLEWAIRQARERRELALELRKDLGEPVRTFELRASVKDQIETVGAAIRTYLGVTQADQQTWRAKAFDNWRTAIEAKDVLVFMVPRLALTEMRGVAIAETKLPIILINSKDRTNGRTFTLLHEFCHLVVRASGISGLDFVAPEPASAVVEQFCNAVAGAALAPSDWLLSEHLVRAKGQVKTWHDDELAALAGRFGVSREVILRRLLTLGRTTQAFYESRRASFQAEYDALGEKKSSGGPERHLVVLSQLGRGFTRLVFQGYYDRQLTLRDVASHLNMQVTAVPNIERAAFGLTG